MAIIAEDTLALEAVVPKGLLPIALLISTLTHVLVLAFVAYWFIDESKSGNLNVTHFLNASIATLNADEESGQGEEKVIEEKEIIEEEYSPLNPAQLSQELIEEIAVSSSPPSSAEKIARLASLSSNLDIQKYSPATEEVTSEAIEQENLLTTFNINEFAVAVPRVSVEQEFATVPVAKVQQVMLAKRLVKWQKNMQQLFDREQPIVWRDGGQVFSAIVKKIEPHNNTDVERATVEISTELDGSKLSTQLQMKRLAFSNFAQFVNRWDPEVMLSNDHVEGRFHSNSRLIIASDRNSKPLFSGKVSVASSISMQGRGKMSEIFLGGLEKRVKRIAMPKKPLFSFTPDALQAKNTHIIESDAQIEFLPSGEYIWHSLATPDDKHISAIADGVQFIVATEKNRIDVKGVVKGNVVVYSPSKINVIGDLRYVRDPEQFPDSEDYLALISEKYVEVAEPKITGRGDISIYAAIYAKRRFVVRRYRTRNTSLLTIYGSLTAGSLSATEPRFATLLRFDKRFENKRPANFPMTDSYELDSWNKQWTLSNVKTQDVRKISEIQP